MEKLRNDKNLPEQTEEFSNLDDWWLDEEDSADSLPVFDPDEAENYAKDRQRLTGVPMVTGYGTCGRKSCKKVNLRSGTVERKTTEK